MRLEDRYDSYVIEGKVKVLDTIQENVIRDCFRQAEKFALEGKMLAQNHKAKDSFFDVLEKMYGALEQYGKGLILTQKIEVSDPEALFFVVCVGFPLLELDPYILDNIYVKIAEGGEFKQVEWRRIEVAVMLFLSAMKEESERF